MSTVPFGKYKGQPVEALLNDREYLVWLSSQPWFRAKFAHLLGPAEQEDMARTPAHNRLQAMFLDDLYVMTFSRFVADDKWQATRESVERSLRSSIGTCNTKLAAALDYPDEYKSRYPKEFAKRTDLAISLERSLATLTNFNVVDACRCVAKFEEAGSDVLILCFLDFPALDGSYHSDGSTYCDRREFHLGVEVKPVMGDDYPAVLRQMNRNRSSFLFLDKYDAEGATFEQVCKIFQRSEKRIVLKEWIDVEARNR